MLRGILYYIYIHIWYLRAVQRETRALRAVCFCILFRVVLRLSAAVHTNTRGSRNARYLAIYPRKSNARLRATRSSGIAGRDRSEEERDARFTEAVHAAQV